MVEYQVRRADFEHENGSSNSSLNKFAQSAALDLDKTITGYHYDNDNEEISILI